MTRVLAIATLTALLGAAQRAPAEGTAAITGIMVSAEDGKTPIRRVHVTLNSVDRSFGDLVVTDDDGVFRFVKLQAGRYVLGATKPAYVRAQYGESRPGRIGTPIAVAAGQSLTGIVFPLGKGAVLGGTVLDASGEPARGHVTIFRRSETARRWSEAGSGTLDDRGMFRVFGLRAGEYLVASQARLDPFGTAGLELPAVDRGPATPIGYAPVFFPGTPLESAATVIALKPAEERTNLDFSMQFVRMSQVKGVVTDPDGGDARRAMVFMMSTSPLIFEHPYQEEGSRFHFPAVAPGEYQLAALVQAEKGESKWAAARVTANGGDVSDIVLTLRRGFTMTGRIVTEGAPQPAGAVPMVRVRALPGSDRLVLSGYPDPPNPDGSFTIHGLSPGRYQLIAHDESPEFAWTWSLKSVVINGTNVAHAPIEIDGDIRDVVVTFTARIAELSGTLQDASGRAAPDYHIVVFPADRKAWLPGSARVQTTRPGTDGGYLIRGLPAGEYLLAALTDLEPDDWKDPDFLEQLVPAAIKVSIGEGEKKSQNIRIAR